MYLAQSGVQNILFSSMGGRKKVSREVKILVFLNLLNEFFFLFNF